MAPGGPQDQSQQQQANLTALGYPQMFNPQVAAANLMHSNPGMLLD